MRGTVQINEIICKGCSLCVLACPKQALSMAERLNPRGYHPVELSEPDMCTGCALCAVACPDAALTVLRFKPTPKPNGTAKA